MSTVFEGRKRSVSVPIGSVLQFSASTGTGSVVRRPNPNNGEPGSPVALTGAALTVGPFDVVSLFSIATDTGRIDFDIAPVSSTAVGRLQSSAPRNVFVTAGRNTSIYLPVGEVLSVGATIGTGSFVRLPNPNNGEPGPVTLFNGSALTFGPFDVPALYRITCATGFIALLFAIDLAGGVTPGIPTLTLTGPLTFAADAAAGTLVANINNVPAGVTPTITPNDGRLQIVGSSGAWMVVKGGSASSAGNLAFTVNAVGAQSASATALITAALNLVNITPPSFNADVTNIADGQIVPIVAGTWRSDVGTITRGVYRDGVLIAGTTGATSYTYSLANDAGRAIDVRESIAAGDVAKSAAIIQGASAAPFYALNFASATSNMQSLNGFDAWAPDAAANQAPTTIGIKNDGIYALAASNNTMRIMKNVGNRTTYSTRMRIPGGANAKNAYDRFFYVRFLDSNNWIALNFGYFNIYLSQRYNFNTYSTKIGGTPPVITSDLLAEVRITGNYAQVWFNNVRVDDPALNGGLGIDVSNVPNGPSIGLYQAANVDTEAGRPNTAFPFKLFDKIDVVPIVANSISLAAVDLTYANGQQTARLTGTTQGNPANLRYLVLNGDGTVAVPWTALGAVTANAFAYDIPALPKSVEGGNAKFFVQDAAAPDILASLVKAVPEYQTVGPFVKGMNEGFMSAGYYSHTHRNLGKRLDWRADNYGIILQPGAPARVDYVSADEVGMGYDGIIKKYRAGGQQNIRGIFQRYVPPGSYTGTYPAVLTATFGELSANVTVTQAPSNGTFKFTVGGDGMMGNGSPNINFTGPIPASGIIVDIYNDADTRRDLQASDELIAWYKHSGTKVIRHMTAQAIVGDNVTRSGPSQEYTGSPSNGPINLAFMVEVCNRVGADLWINLSHLWGDDYIAYVAKYLNDNLKTTVKFYKEDSNEIWNTDPRFTQNRWFRLEGVRRGYHNTLGNAPPFAGLMLDLYTDKWFGDTGVSRIPIAAGTRVQASRDGQGTAIWEALQDIPADLTSDLDHRNGTKITTYAVANPSGDNAYWKLIADLGASTLACKRMHADRARRTSEIFDANIANPRTRYVRTLGGWDGGGWSYSTPVMDWNNFYQVCDMWHTAPYWQANLLTYGTNEVSGWGDAQRDLVVTDPAAFLTGLFSKMPTAIQRTTDRVAANKHGMARYLKNKYGLPIDAMAFGSYECGFGERVFGNWPLSSRPAIAAQWPVIYRDARMEGIETLYYTQMAQKAGGVHCVFDRIGRTITSEYSSNPDQFELLAWNISQKENDVGADNARYTAYSNYPTTPPAYVVVMGDGA